MEEKKEKKGLGIRDRRRIYDDAVSIINQVEKMQSKTKEEEMRIMEKLFHKQRAKALEIITVTLGYHEVTSDTVTMLVPEDGNAEYSINKNSLEKVLRDLPKNKELKESLWKSCIKRDTKSTTRLKMLLG